MVLRSEYNIDFDGYIALKIHEKETIPISLHI